MIEEIADHIKGVILGRDDRRDVTVELKRQIRGMDTPTTLSSATAQKPAHLTDGQARALLAISQAAASANGDVVLVDGVTGSGNAIGISHGE